MSIQSKQFIVKGEVLEATLQYLISKPFKEVNGLISALQTSQELPGPENKAPKLPSISEQDGDKQPRKKSK